MREELLSRLRHITLEEQELLSGKQGIERARYTDKQEFTVVSSKMLEKGKLIDIRTHTRFCCFPKHKHDYIEIIYMCAGSTTHWIDENEKVILKTGDLLFLNQHASHAIEAATQEDIAINFIVLPEFFDVAFSMLQGENELRNFLVNSLRQDTGYADFLHFKVADVVPIQNLVENMVWSILEKPREMQRINQITMGLLFLQLLNHTDKIESGSEEQKERNLVMAALRYIEENYKTASLKAFSKEKQRTIYSLSKIIKQNTGSNFKELLQFKRFQKAVQLLIETRLSVSDIITAVGYDNTSYFYRVFRQKYGMSPREYRAFHSNIKKME